MNISDADDRSGYGVYSVMTGTGNSGYAGYFNNTGSANTGSAVYATNATTTSGYAGYFSNESAVGNGIYALGSTVMRLGHATYYNIGDPAGSGAAIYALESSTSNTATAILRPE